MSRKGVLVGLISLMLLSLSCAPVSAMRSSATLTWGVCGLKVGVRCENSDFWTTDVESDIHIRLTLADLGSVAEFIDLTLVLLLITESNDSEVFAMDSPWTHAGETIDLVGRFNITPEQVNNSAWEMYDTGYYYQLNQTVRLDNGTIWTLYTNLKGPFHVGISTAPYIVYWPFPPIILMIFVSWGGLVLLKKFNRRYEGLEAKSEA